jgi:hypothetical protein
MITAFPTTTASTATYSVASTSFYPQKKALQAKRQASKTLVETVEQVLEFHSVVYSQKKRLAEVKAL